MTEQSTRALMRTTILNGLKIMGAGSMTMVCAAILYLFAFGQASVPAPYLFLLAFLIPVIISSMTMLWSSLKARLPYLAGFCTLMILNSLNGLNTVFFDSTAGTMTGWMSGWSEDLQLFPLKVLAALTISALVEFAVSAWHKRPAASQR